MVVSGGKQDGKCSGVNRSVMYEKQEWCEWQVS